MRQNWKCCVCDFQEVILNQRWLLILSPLPSSILIAWNVNTMAMLQQPSWTMSLKITTQTPGQDGELQRLLTYLQISPTSEKNNLLWVFKLLLFGDFFITEPDRKLTFELFWMDSTNKDSFFCSSFKSFEVLRGSSFAILKSTPVPLGINSSTGKLSRAGHSRITHVTQSLAVTGETKSILNHQQYSPSQFNKSFHYPHTLMVGVQEEGGVAISIRISKCTRLHPTTYFPGI